MKKSSNKTLDNFTVSANEYGYILGKQDGTFPDFGVHSAGEMLGVWIHPIKLLDGFWMQVNGELLRAENFTIFPYADQFDYSIPGTGIKAKRLDFMPEGKKGAVITYTFINDSMDNVSLDASFISRIHLFPVWLSDKKQIEDGHDHAKILEGGIIAAWDEKNPWYCAVSSQSADEAVILPGTPSPDNNKGDGVTCALNLTISIPAGSTMEKQFFIAGSYTDEKDALEQLAAIKENHASLLEQKKKTAQKIEENSKLTTDYPDFDEMVSWVKQNTVWLDQRVEGVGRGLAAGVPEYAWWFGCDNSYSIQGCLVSGMISLAKDTALLLKNLSEQENGNGRIIHEITTYGAVYNQGNTQEAAHYIVMVYKIFMWTGDLAFLKEVYDYCKKAINWLFSKMNRENLCPAGAGIIEIEGLDVKMIDSAVYTCEALLNMYELSVAMKEENLFYLENGKKLQKFINEFCWMDDEGQFCDAIASTNELLSRIENLRNYALGRKVISQEFLNYLDNFENRLIGSPDKAIPAMLGKNWIIFTPMEAGIADKDKAVRALETSFNPEYIGEYGPYLSASMKDAVMTISSGIRAVAEARYGRVNESLSVLNRMKKTFGVYLPGSICEMSPDYGCYVQAWTIYSTMVPLVNWYAGIRADGIRKKVTIQPDIPDDFNRFSLENVLVGDGGVSLHVRRSGDGMEIEIYSTLNKWTAEFVLPDGCRMPDGETANRLVGSHQTYKLKKK